MAGKKHQHPLLTVLLIILGVALLLGTIAAVVVTFVSPVSPLSFSQKIGVIPIKGTITTAQPIISELIRFRKDKAIKAIIVRIDSPGGGVGPSQEIYEELKKTRKEKNLTSVNYSTSQPGNDFF